MRGWFAVIIGLAMQTGTPSQPPQILQIHREALKPGSEAAYQQIEEDTARVQSRLGCPHPYLAIESLTGTKEVWFFNGYRSSAEQRQVYDDYARNTRLAAALQRNSKLKSSLTFTPTNTFANYRPDLTVGVPWTLGRGRYLVITVTKNTPRSGGTVFEAEDGTKFIVTAAHTRAEADAAGQQAGSQSKIFAVRPSWSFPATEWIAADPPFWRQNSTPKQD